MAMPYDERRVSFIANEVLKQSNRPILGGFLGLTPSGISPCAALDDDLNLQDAAVELGLSYETVRQRVKVVFQKTGVRSQSALCALLAQ